MDKHQQPDLKVYGLPPPTNLSDTKDHLRMLPEILSSLPIPKSSLLKDGNETIKTNLSSIAGSVHIHSNLLSKSANHSKLPSISKQSNPFQFQNEGLQSLQYQIQPKDLHKRGGQTRQPEKALKTIDYGQMVKSMEAGDSRGARRRNDGGSFNTIQPGNRAESPSSKQSSIAHNSLVSNNQLEFSQNLSKVIASVTNRRKMPRLKSLVVEDKTVSFKEQEPFPPKSATQISLVPDQNFLSQNDDYIMKDPLVSHSRGRTIQLYDPLRNANNSMKKTHVKSFSISKSQAAEPVSILGNRNLVQKEPKATEQVAYLLQQIQKKGQIFMALERNQDPNSSLIFKENKNPPENNSGVVVFSKNGFVSVAREGQQLTDFISNDQFIMDGVSFQILKELPFFKKFQQLRFFRQWKQKMRLNAYERKRQLLAQNFVFARPIFSEKYKKLVTDINSSGDLQLAEIQSQITYGKKQQFTLEEKCKTVLLQNKAAMEAILTEIKDKLARLKTEIEEDDQRFQKEINEAKVQELIRNNNKPQTMMFYQQRVKMEEIQEQYNLMDRRHRQFDLLLAMVYRYWSTKIVQMLLASKKRFVDVYQDKNPPFFEVTIWFSKEGRLDFDPTMDEHRSSFIRVFEDMENAVFKNQSLQFIMHDLSDLFFFGPSSFALNVFENIERILRTDSTYKLVDKQIFEKLEIDIDRCRGLIDEYENLHEIFIFCNQWKRQKDSNQGNLDMEAYNNTRSKMKSFEESKKRVPARNLQFGAIMIETATLRKQLEEMPREVNKSLRDNMTDTLKQIAEKLKDDISKYSDSLEQLPTQLNTYITQLNQLKLMEQMKGQSDRDFDFMINLREQCKNDNIKVELPVNQLVEEVKVMYTDLPRLQKTAVEQLAQNRETMHKIMIVNSDKISKSIKNFHERYVARYVRDSTRLEDCGETLEEIYKRSKSLHELRTKVIMYREFLRMLYEEDTKDGSKKDEDQYTLKCMNDYEMMYEIHRHTIRLWKILLYWKKRRQMCYMTPFLHLDVHLIIKSISKVSKYLDDKLTQHDLVFRESTKIQKIVRTELKEASLILEFVKDLTKESMQQRHWEQIFDLIKAPQLKQEQNKFTIVDLRDYNIQNYKEEIQQISEHANTELKYETIFKCICQEWEQLELKIIPFKDNQNSYLMVNTDTLIQAIEENLNTLEMIAQSEYAAHIKKDIEVWLLKLKQMHENLEVWIDAQRYWINLDIIYNSGLFSNIFGPATKQFIDTRLQFQRIMWSSYKNSKATYNLLIQSRIDTFRKMRELFQILQIKVHDFLEKKRLHFSRFFFLNDSQFLEFLTLVNTNQDFSSYINSLFIGAQNLYVQPSDNLLLKKNEQSLVENADNKLQRINESANNSSQVSYAINQAMDLGSGRLGSQQIKDRLEDYQVLGLISSNKELLLFESPVLIQNDNQNVKEVEGHEISGVGTGNIEMWLTQVENQMNQTMKKQMKFAIKAFATRSLDEWVLDYPQQIIVTALNLILSNEINDILEETQRIKDREESEGSNYGEDDNISGGRAGTMEDDDAAEDEGGSQTMTQDYRNKKGPRAGTRLKKTKEEERKLINQELFGTDFVDDDRFEKAVEKGREELRNKRHLSNGAGKKVITDHKDWVLEALGAQTFYGVYLRILFWINKLVRSLYEDKRMEWDDLDLNLELTSVQKMIISNVVLCLLHHRDNVQKMITLDIQDKNDFEWQSKFKVFWQETDPADPLKPEGVYVQCGGWNQLLGSEYLGSKHRLPLSPLTDRYFVFMSSALREKSSLLFRCNQSHQQSEDIFEEFASQCHLPFKSYLCNEELKIDQLMQVINGAAMAMFWVHFEHLDNLPLTDFQIVIKEIQMVQQQYIIAELNQQDKAMYFANKEIHISQDRKGARAELVVSNPVPKLIIDNTSKQPPGSGNISDVPRFMSVIRPSLGIFGSISSRVIIKYPQIANKLNLEAQSIFRSMSLSKPDPQVILRMILKAEGFRSYERLTKTINDFLMEFTRRKNLKLYGKEEPNEVKMMSRVTESLVNRDIRVAIRHSILLRDQEWKGYLEKIFVKQQRQSKFVLFLYEKSVAEFEKESVIKECIKEFYAKDRNNIELESVKQGFRMILKTKFFNEWRRGRRDQCCEVGISREITEQLMNEIQEERNLENLILDTFNEVAQRVEKELQTKEEKKPGIVNLDLNETEDLDPIGVDVRNTICRGNQLGRRKGHNQTTKLMFAGKREKFEEIFMNTIEGAFKKVTKAMELVEKERQLEQCVDIIELMRRQKAIAIVGPVCSGKTQILKLVSQTLKFAYNISFRTSVINPKTFSKEELYGPSNAFEAENKQDRDQALRKKSIFQIVLDNYQNERLKLTPAERNNFIQSFLIDSNSLDPAFLDCLIPFIQKSNIREREYTDDREFLLQLSSLGQAHETLIQPVSITLPNGNIIVAPSDFYFFFETEDIGHASPRFISQVGIVIAQDKDIQYQDIFIKLKNHYLLKHSRLTSEFKFKTEKYLTEWENSVFYPMMRMVDEDHRFRDWSLWNPKSLVIGFFKLFNSLTYKLTVNVEKNNQAEESEYMEQLNFQNGRKSCIWNMAISAFFLTFGAVLNSDLLQTLIEIFSKFRNLFNLNERVQLVTNPTIMQVHFNPENLFSEAIEEKLEYKLKVAYSPIFSTILIPSQQIALSYYIMDLLSETQLHEKELNKNLRLYGGRSTSKSVILNSYAQRTKDRLESVVVPQSAYLSFNLLRKQIENQYVAKRKQILVPKNPDKKVLLVVDDLHLQDNFKVDLLEFIRTWSNNSGYFDVGAGHFKRITDFSVIMAQSSTYRTKEFVSEGRSEIKNRFLFQTNTLYLEDRQTEHYKQYVQHWLTSKIWNSNKLLQKYYIIVTNCLMEMLSKIQRTDAFNNSSFMKLHNFELVSRFCSSLVNHLIISDDASEISLRDQREEDAMANMVLYEVMRNYQDRIYKPQDRVLFLQKLVEIFRHEFQMKEAIVEKIDSLTLGNYHDRQHNAHLKLINNQDQIGRVKDMITQKIVEKTNNHMLVTYLDAPCAVRDVFRLSRILFREQSHLIFVGSPASPKHELLQIAAILNDVVLLELNVSRFNDPLKFANAFKEALLTVAKLDTTNAFILINEEQQTDPVYIDFVHNYIVNLGKDENSILMDEVFSQQLTQVELDLFIKNKDNFKYDKNKKPDPRKCLENGVRKLMKLVHVVLMVQSLHTYYEWCSLFPNLESKCDVIFLDDLTSQGYQSFARVFLNRTKIDEDMDEKECEGLVKSIVQAKEIAKNKIFENFYTHATLKNYVVEPFLNGLGLETIYPNEKKAHFFLFEDGNFRVHDPLLKQVGLNLRSEVNGAMQLKFVMYLELFRFMYDFLSLNLQIRKNYFETFIGKTKQFNQFFEDINSKKKDLHQAANNMNFKMTMIQDKINRLNKQVEEKIKNIVKRQEDIADLSIQLANLENEVEQVLGDKKRALKTAVEDIKEMSISDLFQATQGEQSKNEQSLILTVLVIIEKDAQLMQFEKEQHEVYFSHPHDLADILGDRSTLEFNNLIFRRIKEFVTKSKSEDFQRAPIIRLLFQYISELYRKLNVRNTMSYQYSQIAELKAAIEQKQFSIQYSEKVIKQKKIELKLVEEKIERVKEREEKLSQKIEVAEISNMRTKQILSSVREYGLKVERKLDQINNRIQCLLGDCIILAASICFLGYFSTEERVQLRHEISKFVDDVQGIKCSKIWAIDKDNDNPRNHTKMIKQILKEFGLKQVIMNHQYSGILTEQVVCEVLFHLLFSPSCPLVVDPTGEIMNFVKDKLLSGTNCRKLYASDLSINSQLQQVFRSQNQFALLTDLNNFDKSSFGLTQDKPLLQRLCNSFYNGIDFNYERQLLARRIPSFEDSILTSFSALNKKMPLNDPSLENVSQYQVQVFQSSFEFQNGVGFMSRGSSIVGMATNEEILENDRGVTAWMEIEEILLEQVNKKEWGILQEMKAQIKKYVENKTNLERNYENNFLVANHETLKIFEEYSSLKQSIEDMQAESEEREAYQQFYAEFMDKYQILAYYSNIILNIFLSLKQVAKIMNEPTCSWRLFKQIVADILRQILKNLAHEAIASKKNEKGKKKTSQNEKGNPQIEIDMSFFQKNFIPKVHKTMATGLKQESCTPMFNLVLAVRISLQQGRITNEEMRFFFKHLLVLRNFQDWRKTELDFVDMEDIIPKTKLLNLKKELTRLYPEIGRKFVEKLESELGSPYKYKDASMFMFKLIQDPNFQDLSLMQEICLGFLCPDHEFKSKLTQLVYTQLSQVFDFSEEYSKLHQFLSRASWKAPIALLSVSHINVVNTISSIAQHYGVGIDVIRQDHEGDTQMAENYVGVDRKANQAICTNLIDETQLTLQMQHQRYQRVETMATNYLPRGNVADDHHHAPLQKLNFVQNLNRQQFLNPDKNLNDEQQDPVKIIEEAATNGSWVLISTIRFPQFARRAAQKIEQLHKEGRVDEQFRIIFDLQGLAQSDIPESFLFDQAIQFHLTEQNSEDLQGFDDIWSAILDERVLVKLTEKIETMRDKILEEQTKKGEVESKSDEQKSQMSIFAKKEKPESPTNYKLIESNIKSEHLKSLYINMMTESKAMNEGLRFNLLRADSDTFEKENSHSDSDLKKSVSVRSPDIGDGLNSPKGGESPDSMEPHIYQDQSQVTVDKPSIVATDSTKEVKMTQVVTEIGAVRIDESEEDDEAEDGRTARIKNKESGLEGVIQNYLQSQAQIPGLGKLN